MHFQYLVEDQSGAALIRILMQKRFSRDRWIHKKKYDKRNKNRKVTQRFSNILARL